MSGGLVPLGGLRRAKGLRRGGVTGVGARRCVRACNAEEAGEARRRGGRPATSEAGRGAPERTPAERDKARRGRSWEAAAWDAERRALASGGGARTAAAAVAAAAATATAAVLAPMQTQRPPKQLAPMPAARQRADRPPLASLTDSLATNPLVDAFRTFQTLLAERKNGSAGDSIGYFVQTLFMQSLAVKLTVLFSLIVPFVGIGALLYRLAKPDTSIGQALFNSYCWLINVCGADATGEGSPAASLVANVLFMFGLLTFAILLGFVTDEISAGIDAVKTGNFRILASGHTVILNWNQQTVPLVRQLLAARAEGREEAIPLPIVILTDMPRDMVEEELNNEIDDPKIRNGIIVRTGTPYDPGDHERVGLSRAKKVIVLHQFPNEAADFAERTLLEGSKAAALLGLTNKQDVVVQMRISDNTGRDLQVPDLMNMTLRDLERGIHAGDSVPHPRIVYGSFTMGRMLAQCAFQEGLANGLEILLTQAEGSPEMYVNEFPQLEGLSFAQARNCFDQAYVIGIGNHEGELLLPPNDEYICRKDDLFVGIADSEHVFTNFLDEKKVKEFVENRGQVAIPEPDVQSYNSFIAKGPVNMLVAGWNNEIGRGFLRGWSECANPGSTLTILAREERAMHQVEALQSTMKAKGLNLRLIEGSQVNSKDLIDAGALEVDSLIVLSPHGDSADVRDATILASLLVASDLPYDKTKSRPSALAIVTKTRTKELIAQANARGALRFGKFNNGYYGQVETLLVDEIISGTMVQSAASAEVGKVINQLMLNKKNSSQVCMHPASLYINGDEETIPFERICNKVDETQNRAIAIGYLQNRDGDHNTVICPPLHGMVTLRKEDEIYVLQVI